MPNDKRYWKFQNGEMIEQKRTRTQLKENFLETLKITGKERKGNQDLMKELEDMTIEHGLGGSPYRLEAREPAQEYSNGPLYLDKGKQDLPQQA